MERKDRGDDATERKDEGTEEKGSESVSLPRRFLDLLARTVARTTQRLRVDRLRVQLGTVGTIDIDSIQVGTANIETIEIVGLSAELQSGRAFLGNVRAVAALDLTLTWKVDLGYVGEWGDTNHLGELSVPFDLPDLAVPALENLSFSAPRVNVPGVNASVAPLVGIQLRDTELTNVAVNDVVVPTAGFSLDGLGIGSVQVNGVSVPAASSASATVEQVTTTAGIIVPEITVRELAIPSTQVPNVEAPPFGVTAQTAQVYSTGRLNLGVLEIELQAQPALHLNIGRLVIQDIQLAAMARELNVRDIIIPLRLQGLTVSDIDLSRITINSVRI